MLPRLHPEAELHRSLANTELPCKTSDGRLPGAELPPCGDNRFIREFMEAIVFSVKMTVSPRSFFIHILDVVGLRSKPKVSRINTRRVVFYRAIMENALAFWNWTKMKYPRSNMRPSRVSLYTPAYLAVTVRKLRAGPDPACVGLRNLRPKALWKCFGKTLRSQILTGNLNHNLVLAPFGLQGQRSFFIFNT